MEEWKWVDGSRVYEVSSMGRVRSRQYGWPRIMSTNSGEYPRVNISLDGVARTRYVHRLVCVAFHGPQPEGRPHVAHFDGDRRNNAASNLRWASASENMSDRSRHGNHVRGAHSVWAKLTETDVLDIRRRYANGGVSYREIAEDYPVCGSAIGDIIHRRTWAHL